MQSFPTAVLSMNQMNQWVCHETTADFFTGDLDFTIRSLVTRPTEDHRRQVLTLPSGRTGLLEWLQPGRLKVVAVDSSDLRASEPTPSDSLESNWFQEDIGPSSVDMFSTTVAADYDGAAIDLASTDLLDLLDRLDELAFAAIAGGAAELDSFRQAWPKLKSRIDRRFLEESRSQYVRQLLQRWPSHNTNSDRAAHAHALLELMFD